MLKKDWNQKSAYLCQDPTAPFVPTHRWQPPKYIPALLIPEKQMNIRNV